MASLRPPSRHARRAGLACVAAALALALAACGGGSSESTEPPDVAAPTYVKSYGLAGADVISPQVSARPDGGQMMAGVVQSPGGTPQVMVARLDGEGNVRWARQVGRVRLGDYPLTQTLVARAAADGTVWATGDSPRGAAVVRLSPAGAVLGVTELPGRLQLRDIAFVPGGEVRLVGEVSRDGPGGLFDRRLWIARLAGNGQLLETDTPTPLPADAAAGERVVGLRVGSGGSFVVFGSRGRGPADYWLASFTAEGTLRYDDTHTDFYALNDVSGEALAATFVGRNPDSTVPGARVVTVGRIGTTGPAGKRLTDSKLIVHDEIDGSERQNRSVEQVPDRDNHYFDVWSGPGSNDLRLLGAVDGDPSCGSSVCGPSIWFEQLRRRGESYETLSRRQLSAASSFGKAASIAPDGHLLVMLADPDREQPELLKLDGNDPSRVLWRHSMADLAGPLREPQMVWGSENWLPVTPRIAGTPDGGALIAAGASLVSLDANGNRRFARFAAAEGTSVPLRTPGSALARPIVQALPGGGAVLMVPAADGRLLWLRYDDEGQVLSSMAFDGWQAHGAVVLDVDRDGQRDNRLLLLASNGFGHYLLRLEPDGTLVDQRVLPTSVAILGHPSALVDGPDGAAAMGNGPDIMRFDAAGEPAGTWRFMDGVDGSSMPLSPSGLALGSDGSLHLALRGSGSVARLLSITRDGGVRLRSEFSVANRSIRSVAVAALPDGRVAMQAALAIDGFDGDLARSLDDADAVAWRVEPDGRVNWVRRYGTARSDTFGLAALSGRDNGVLALGSSSGFTTPARSVLAGRLDANGSAGPGCQAEQPAPQLQAVVDTTPTRVTVEAAQALQPVTSARVLAAPVAVLVEDSALNLLVARACGGVSEAPTMSLQVGGAGEVLSVPNGLACSASAGSDCTQSWTSGAEVTLRAVPRNGARFLGWSGDCARFGSADAIALTASTPLACGAEFSAVAAPGTISVAFTGNGDGEVMSDRAEIVCFKARPSSNCSAGFAAGAAVRLDVIPFPPSRVGTVTGCDRWEPTAQACFLTVSGPRTITVELLR